MLDELLLKLRGNDTSWTPLANRLGVQRGTIENWINGSNAPGKPSREAIARVAGISVDEVDAILDEGVLKAPIVHRAVISATSCKHCNRRHRDSKRRRQCAELAQAGLPVLCEPWDEYDVIRAQASGVLRKEKE